MSLEDLKNAKPGMESTVSVGGCRLSSGVSFQAVILSHCIHRDHIIGL
jgi:hypothetical protein